MVELCVGLGQEHPEGVLHLPDTKEVLAFQCNSNMMATMCCVTVTMVWQGEPVVLHILPLKGRQMRDYIIMRSSLQSGVKHMFRVGVDTLPLPSMPSLDEGPQRELTRDVWTTVLTNGGEH